MVSSTVSADADENRYITYKDPTGTYDDVKVKYDGIKATEYNPELWTGTGNVPARDVHDNLVVNWTGVTYENISEFNSDGSITTSGTQEIRDHWTGSVTVDSNGVITASSDSTDHTITTGALSITIDFKHDSDKGKDKNYRFKIPTGFVVGSISPNSVTKNEGLSDVNYNVYEFTSTQITTTVTINFTSCTLSPNKVFGGWMAYDEQNGWTMVYPGDVVDESVTELYAKWIEPDVFLLKSDIVYDNRWYNNGASPDHLYTVEVLAPYGILTNVYGNKTLAPIDIDAGYNATYATNLIHGNQRDTGDMFGTIYLLTLEKTRNAEKIFSMNVGSINRNDTPHYLPTGTYRSPLGAAEKTVLYINGSGSGSCVLGGDAIIDNVCIVSNGGNIGTHGDKPGSAIFAYGNKLIMGTGIDNLWKVIDNSTRITNTDTKAADGNGGVPQLFGGKPNGDITAAAVTNKKIVFGDGEAHNLTADLGTFLIVHSGTYYNIVGGSHGVGNDIGEGYSSNGEVIVTNPLSTYVVLKGGSTVDTIAGGSSGIDGTGMIYANPSADPEHPEDAGGAFVYIIGHFTPGDDWEDKNSGVYSGDREKYAIIQSSIIEGGSSRGTSENHAIISGSTHLFISGESSIWDAQASGRTRYTETDCAYMEITGKAVVRHVACGTITDGNDSASKKVTCADHVMIYIGENAMVASVFGGGYDTFEDPVGQSMMEGTISIKVTGGKVGYVFGGGFRGTIGTFSALPENNKLSVNIEISGGEIIHDVYGGGSGGLDKIKHDTVNYDIVRNNKGDKNSTGYSVVYGNIDVTVCGQAVVNGSVYGGGMSLPVLDYYSSKGEHTQERSSDIAFKDIDVNVASVYGKVNVNILDQAVIKESVYGAGKGVQFHWDNNSQKWVFDDEPSYTIIKKVGEEWEFGSQKWYTDTDGNRWYEYKTTGYIDVIGSGANTKAAETSKYLNFAKVIGSTEVYISNGTTVTIDEVDYVGTIKESVYGGGAIGKLEGTSIIVINDGKIEGNVFGGGFGIEGVVSVNNNRTVYITGPLTEIQGSVYGGSSVGVDGIVSERVYNSDIDPQADERLNDYTTGSKIIINEGQIDGSVFGGGFMGRTYGNTKVYIGYHCHYEEGVYEPIEGVHSEGGENVIRISVGSVYAGGNIKASENEEPPDPFSEYLVLGDGLVNVYGGPFRETSITGSIMGSGNSCKTAGYTTIRMELFENKAIMDAIHRADVLTLIESSVQLRGRSTLVPAGTASIYDIGTLILQYDSTLVIEDSVDLVNNFRSFTRYGKPTTPSAPSNRIEFTHGSTFNIRNSSTYGTIEGYAVISAYSGQSYGAYVIGPITSSGGFVTMINGTYKNADTSSVGQTGRCWFISGTENKIVTMNMKGASITEGPETEPSTDVPRPNKNVEKISSNPDVYIDRKLTTIDAEVELTKISNDTVIRYTGGTFTSIGSSSCGEDFAIIYPGLKNDGSLPEDHEFGLIIGLENGDESLVPETERWDYCLPDGAPVNEQITLQENVVSTYFAENISPMVMMTKNGAGAFDAGNYTLNLRFVGAPTSVTSYLGYITLNLQEIKDTETATGHVYLVVNDIEVRIDLYVIAENNVTDNNAYSVKLKTEEKSTDIHQGYTEILIPKGFVMGNLCLDGVSTHNINKGAKLTVAPAINPDNTTGWMTVKNVSLIKQDNEDHNYDRGDISNRQSVGILAGNIPATIRYTVDDLQYMDEDDPPWFILHFTTLDKNGEVMTVSDIKVLVEKKPDLTLYFTDLRGDDSVTVKKTFPYGTIVTEEMCPSTGENFVGWYVDSTYQNRFNHNVPLINDNMTLYSRYMYVVTFDNMRGSTSQLQLPQGAENTIPEESKPTLIDNGYEDVRWFTEPEFIHEWDFTNEVVTGDMTLYAKWIGKEVKVNFYYKVNENFVIYSNTQGYEGYVIKVVGDVPEYLTLRVDSYFDIMDPEREVNVLDSVSADVLAKMGLPANSFIRWQTSDGSQIVDKETVLDKGMVQDLNGTPYINLYAFTPRVAVGINMDKNTTDASAYVSPPNNYIIYPVGPEDTSSPKHDLFGTYYLSSDGKVKFYLDEDTGTYYCMDANDFPVGDDPHWTDHYGNVWSKAGNVYTFVETTAFDSNGDEVTLVGHEGLLCTVSEEVVEIEEVEQIQTVYTPINVGDYYFLDHYANRYQKLNNSIPVLSAENEYTYEKQYSTITHDGYRGSEFYYIFEYTLNGASRPGYQILGWHNIYFEGEDEKSVPRVGTSLTLRLFLDYDANNEQGDKTKVVRELFQLNDNRAVPLQEVRKYSEAVSIADINNVYSIEYDAVWKQLTYPVTVASTCHGDIDAYVIKANGNKSNRVLIEGTYQAIYGDRIVINYTAADNYNFVRWSISGEYLIDDENESSTTLIIHGPTTISVREIGERTVVLNMVFDGNERLKDSHDQYLVVKEKTSVYLYDTNSQKEYELDYDSGFETVGVPIVYKGSVPLAEEYEVYVGHEWEDGTIDKYRMEGTFEIGVETELNYTYYLISAYLDDSNMMSRDFFYIGEPFDKFNTDCPDGCVTYTRYVGALESLIFSQTEEQIINNDLSGLPAVQLTIAPGYTFNVYEGFDDDDSKFKVNSVNHHISTDTHRVDPITVEFNLNWTKFNKPAQIVVDADMVGYTVTYVTEGRGGDQLTRERVMHFGEHFLVEPLGQGPPTFVADDILNGQNDQHIVDNVSHITGYYYQNGNQRIPVRGVDVLDETTVEYISNPIVAPVTTAEVKKATVQVFIQDPEGGEDQKKSTAIIPFTETAPDSGIYTGRFNPIVMPGSSGFEYTDNHNSLPSVTNCEYNLVETEQEVYLLMTATIGDGYVDESLVINVTTLLYTSTMKLADSAMSKALGEGWWTQDEAGRTFRIGKEITMPKMEQVDGVSVSDWTVTCSGSASPEGGRHVVYENGEFTYTICPEDAQKTVTFTPVYPPKTVTVTIVTPVGVFNDGSQRVTATFTAGTVITISGSNEPSTDPTVFNLGPVSPEGAYTFAGFYKNSQVHAPSAATITEAVNEDTTYMADWTIATHDFVCKFDSSKVTVSATADSSDSLNIVDLGNNIKAVKKTVSDPYVFPYHSDISIIIKPAAGYQLDVVGTRADYDIDSPDALSNNMGFRWGFLITEDMSEFEIKVKPISYNVNFIVNGQKLTGDDLLPINIRIQGSQEVLTVSEFPSYTTITFDNYRGIVKAWYTDPASETTPLVDAGSTTYVYTVKEDISLYTTIDYYELFYHDLDGNTINPETVISGDGKRILLPDIETDFPQFYNNVNNVDGVTFIGWATADTYGVKSYKYMPNSDEITIESGRTPTTIHLYPFYLTDGHGEPILYDGEYHSSEIVNAPDMDQNEPTLNVYYSITKKLDSENYSEGSLYPTSAAFKDINVYNEQTETYSNTVYYYVTLGNGYGYGGQYIIDIYGAYSVTYIDGETVVKVVEYKTNTEEIGDAPTLEPVVGYRFDGWFCGDVEHDPTLTIKDFGDEVMNVTFTAKWTRTTTIVFMDRDSEVDTYTIYGDVEVGSLPESGDNPGYSFKGWFIGETELKPTTMTNTLAPENTANAVWEKVTVINFYNGDALVEERVKYGDVEVGALPNNVKKEGYTLVGWFIGETKLEPTTMTSTLAAENDAQAVWTIKTTTIRFITTEVVDERVKYGDVEVGPLPDHGVKEGYTFAGWFLQDGTEITAETMTGILPDDNDAYALWNRNPGPGPEPTPGTPTVDNTERTWEKTVNPDGSTTTKITETTTNEDGSSKEKVTETTSTEDKMVVSVTETLTDAEGRTVINVDEEVTYYEGYYEKTIELVGNDGDFVIKVPELDLDNINDAQEELDKYNYNSVTFQMDTYSGDFFVPEVSMDVLAENGYAVMLSNYDFKVVLDKNTTKHLDDLRGDVLINIEKAQDKDLNDAQKAVVGDNYAITIQLFVGGQNVTQLGGTATVSVGQKGAHIYYIDDDGNAEEIPCEYSRATGDTTFIVGHFSIYMLTSSEIPDPDDPEKKEMTLLFYLPIAILIVTLAAIAVIMIRKK